MPVQGNIPVRAGAGVRAVCSQDEHGALPEREGGVPVPVREDNCLQQFRGPVRGLVRRVQRSLRGEKRQRVRCHGHAVLRLPPSGSVREWERAAVCELERARNTWRIILILIHLLQDRSPVRRRGPPRIHLRKFQVMQERVT